MKTITLPADASNEALTIPASQISSFYAAAGGLVKLVSGPTTYTYTTAQASDEVAAKMVRQIAFAIGSTGDGNFQIVDTSDAPSNAASSNTGLGIITVSWDAVGANYQYSLLRSLVSGSGYVEVYSGGGTSVDDAAPVGGPYYYVVVASNTAGESPYSTEVSAVSNTSPAIVSASPTNISYGGGTVVTIIGFGFQAPMDAGAVVQIDPDGTGSGYQNCAVNYYSDTVIQIVTVPTIALNVNLRLFLDPNELALAQDILTSV